MPSYNKYEPGYSELLVVEVVSIVVQTGVQRGTGVFG